MRHSRAGVSRCRPRYEPAKSKSPANHRKQAGEAGPPAQSPPNSSASPFSSFAIVALEKPRIARKRACFARSACVCGTAPNFLRQTDCARSNSLSRNRAPTDSTSASPTAWRFSSLMMRAEPTRDARRCTRLSANRESDSQFSRSSASSSDSTSSLSSACGVSLRASSARLYSRRDRYATARPFSVRAGRCDADERAAPSVSEEAEGDESE
ncbi:regulatory RecX domain protein [Burkholderia pseudomallei TSV32]|nr:regulatory RecX domain protein [Burkholderia pseudomallei TSV32]